MCTRGHRSWTRPRRSGGACHMRGGVAEIKRHCALRGAQRRGSHVALRSGSGVVCMILFLVRGWCWCRMNFPTKKDRCAAATDATAHKRRSFLVVLAASRRSRRTEVSAAASQRSWSWRRYLPLLLGGGVGGLFIPMRKNTTICFTCDFRLPPRSPQEPALGFAPLRGTCTARRFFWAELKENNPNKHTQKSSPQAIGGDLLAVFAAPPPWQRRMQR